MSKRDEFGKYPPNEVYLSYLFVRIHLCLCYQNYFLNQLFKNIKKALIFYELKFQKSVNTFEKGIE